MKHIEVSLGLCEEPLTVVLYHNITLNQYESTSRLGDYKQTNKPKAFPRKRKDGPIKLGKLIIVRNLW